MILNWKTAWNNERLNRESIKPDTICTFGVKPLDDALIGFLPDDLIVLAADSGTGKSHIGKDVAIHNAMNGRNVALYSIEGNDEAAMANIKWKIMMKLYYDANRHDIDWDYRKWLMNIDKSDKVKELEAAALAYLEDKIKDRLHIYHCEEKFTLDDFSESLMAFIKTKDGKLTHFDIDLIVIDHLQYFSFDNPMTELSDTTEILKLLKNIANNHKIPVLLISHLRKKDKNRGLPNQEDLFGTSNIAKICSQCIVIAPSYAGTDYYNDVYPTFFRFVKGRTGLKSNFAILSDFHLRTGNYADEYKLIWLHENQPKDEFKIPQLPKWAYKPQLRTIAAEDLE